MQWWYLGLWQTYYLPMLWWTSCYTPQSHEVIHVDFKRRKILKVA